MGYLKMVIEFDFVNVINWCNKEEGGLWKVVFALNLIRIWKRDIKGVEIM